MVAGTIRLRDQQSGGTTSITWFEVHVHELCHTSLIPSPRNASDSRASSSTGIGLSTRFFTIVCCCWRVWSDGRCHRGRRPRPPPPSRGSVHTGLRKRQQLTQAGAGWCGLPRSRWAILRSVNIDGRSNFCQGCQLCSKSTPTAAYIHTYSIQTQQHLHLEKRSLHTSRFGTCSSPSSIY